MREVRRLIRVTRSGLLFVMVILLLLCHSVEAGLVSYWAAEGNPHDSAGPNPGTEVGSVTCSAGQFGQAFTLAKTGHIDVADPAAGRLESATGFTVAAWICRNGVGRSWGPASVANLWTSENNSGFSLEEVYQQANSMAFHINTGA